jgi:hypothetical protein
VISMQRISTGNEVICGTSKTWFLTRRPTMQL